MIFSQNSFPLPNSSRIDLDDVVGVGVVLGEDERLGDFGAAGEDLGEEAVAEGADDGADLVGGDDVAVELIGGVGEVLVELPPADLPGLAVALVDILLGLDGGAALGDGGGDFVNAKSTLTPSATERS